MPPPYGPGYSRLDAMGQSILRKMRRPNLPLLAVALAMLALRPDVPNPARPSPSSLKGREPLASLGEDSKLSSSTHIQANATGAFHGYVHDEHALPMPQVEVIFAGSGVWPARKAVTDSKGRFHITGVPEGIYEIRATHAKLVADPLEGLLLKDGESREVELVLKPGQTLSAVVRDVGTHKPIANAQVIISEDALGFIPKATRTDNEGRFHMAGLRAMIHRISVRAAGYVPLIGAQHAPGGPPVTFTLERGAVLSGRLVDESGSAIAGASLELMGSETDDMPILLSANTEVFRDALFDAQMNGPTPVYPQGELGVTYGKVPRIPHTPLALPESANPAPVDSRFVSDGTGHFSLMGVPSGKLQIIARHPSYAWSFSNPLIVKAGATLKNITIMLSKGGSIDGQVMDAVGLPVPHVRVQVKVAREPWPRQTLSGNDGRFQVDSLFGVVEIDAYGGRESLARTTLEVQPGMRHAVTLRLAHAAFTLAGQVRERGRFGVAGAQVTVRTSSVRRSTVTGSDGRFALSGLPEPPYSLSVEHADFALYQQSQVAERDDLTIELHPGGAITGQIFDKHRGIGIGNATITARLLEDSREARTAHANTSGKFEISRLIAGNYSLTFSAPGYIPAEKTAVLTPHSSGLSQVDVHSIELEPAGSISGEVVDRHGDPVPGAQVAFGDPPLWEESATTGEKGSFRLEVAPGRYRLSARHPQAGEGTSRRDIRAFAGQDSPAAYLKLNGALP